MPLPARPRIVAELSVSYCLQWRVWMLNMRAAATREEMSANKVPLAYRDSCAHLLIPLNKCRFENYYLPWRCMVRRLATISCGLSAAY